MRSPFPRRHLLKLPLKITLIQLSLQLVLVELCLTFLAEESAFFFPFSLAWGGGAEGGEDFVTSVLLSLYSQIFLISSPEKFICFVLFPLAVDCGSPQPLRNGTLSGNNTVYPNIVKLACDVGFTLRGTPVLKCQANGTWSRTDGFCEGPLCLFACSG